jgi:hypothetical protein
MHERLALNEPDQADRPGRHAPRLHAALAVDRVRALQTTAGNAAVTRMLQRQQAPASAGAPQIAPEAVVKPLVLPMPWELGPQESREPWPDPNAYVFIMGAEDDKTLKLAMTHYQLKSDLLTKIYTPKDFNPTLAGMFDVLSKVKVPLREITIVSHGGGEGTMHFAADAKDKDKQTTPAELRAAVRGGKLAALPPGVVTKDTKIRLRACYVGNNQDVVELMDEAFGGEAVVTAAKVKVGYAGDAIPWEGLTGFWINAAAALTPAELAGALKLKYGDRVVLDPMKHISGPKVGQDMSQDELWVFFAQKATLKKVPNPQKGAEPAVIFHYVAQSHVQRPKETDESDPDLYAVSGFDPELGF